MHRAAAVHAEPFPDSGNRRLGRLRWGRYDCETGCGRRGAGGDAGWAGRGDVAPDRVRGDRRGGRRGGRDDRWPGLHERPGTDHAHRSGAAAERGQDRGSGDAGTEDAAPGSSDDAVRAVAADESDRHGRGLHAGHRLFPSQWAGAAAEAGARGRRGWWWCRRRSCAGNTRWRRTRRPWIGSRPPRVGGSCTWSRPRGRRRASTSRPGWEARTTSSARRATSSASSRTSSGTGRRSAP